MLKNKKSILSWLLIFAMIFTGINWPTFSSFADKSAGEIVGVTNLDASLYYPYILLVAEKTSGATNIYALRSSIPLYYMNEYGYIASRDVAESGLVQTKYYVWNNGWTETNDFTNTYDQKLERHIFFNKTGESLSFEIIDKTELESETFSFDSKDDGNYVFGYGALTGNKSLLNSNFLAYSRTNERGWVYTEESLLKLGSYIFNDSFYDGLETIRDGANQPFDYNDIKTGDEIKGFLSIITKTYNDTITQSNAASYSVINLNVVHNITDVIIFEETNTMSNFIPSDEYNSLSVNEKEDYESASIYVKKNNLEEDLEEITSFDIDDSNTQNEDLYEEIVSYDLSSIDNFIIESEYETYSEVDKEEYIKINGYATYDSIISEDGKSIKDIEGLGESSISNFVEIKEDGTLQIKKVITDENNGGDYTIESKYRSFIIEVTTTISNSNQSYKTYFKVNEFENKKVDDYFNGLKELSFKATIGLINDVNNTETTSSSIYVYGQDETADFNKEVSKEVNRFKIYTLLDNNYADTSNLEIDLDKLTFEIESINGVSDFDLGTLKSTNALDNYIEFVQSVGKDEWYVCIDADAITRYRISSKSRNAFSNVVVVIRDTSHPSLEARMTLNLNVMQYLNGDSLNESHDLNVSTVEFAESLATGYAPLVRDLKLSSLNFTNTIKFLIDYSDYQLLFYSNGIPFLDSDESGYFLTFTEDEVSFEIYKNNNGAWDFYNYLTNVKDAKIYLPEDSTYNAIQFISTTLHSKIGNSVIMEANTIDSSDNMQLRAMSLPSAFLLRNGEATSSSNVFENYSYYYVMKRGQSTYFLIASNEKLSQLEYYITYPQNTKVFVLHGNYWVELATLTNSLVGGTMQEEAKDYVKIIDGYYLPRDVSTFKSSLFSTNDDNFNDVAMGSFKVGSVDFYTRIPAFTIDKGYDSYFISQTKEDGFVLIEYMSNLVKLSIQDGHLKFTKTSESVSSQAIVRKVYSTFNWGETTNLYLNENGRVSDDGILGSIIYTNQDIPIMINGVQKAIISKASMATTNTSKTETTYNVSRPSIANVNKSSFPLTLGDWENTVSNDGVSIDAFFLGTDGFLYVFDKDVATIGKTFVSIDPNITSLDKEDIYYINTTNVGEEFTLTYTKLEFDEDTLKWDYISHNTYKEENVNEADGNIYFFKANDVEYTSFDIKTPSGSATENSYWVLTNTKATFFGENVNNSLTSYEGKQYVNGAAFIEDGEDYYQFLDDDSNYWIFITDKLGNIYNPTENANKASMGMGTSNFKLYVPLFETGFKFMSGSFEYDEDNESITSFSDGKTNIYKSTGLFYNGALTNDAQAPIIKTIYNVSGKIYTFSVDEPEYQREEYDGILEIIIRNNAVYQRVFEQEYNSLHENNRLTNVGKDGKTYYYKKVYDNSEGKYTLVDVDGDGNKYLLWDGIPVNRTTLENGRVVNYYVSGVKNTYIKTLTDEVVFSGNVTVLVDESLGTTRLYEAGESIPIGSMIIVPSGGLPSIEDSLVSASFEFYVVDNFGNWNKVDKVFTAEDLGVTNSIIYGEETDAIKDIIEEAKKRVEEDNVPPEILYAYIYKGVLHVGLRDLAPEGGEPSNFDTSTWYVKYNYMRFTNENDELLEDIDVILGDGSTKTISKSAGYKLKDLIPGNDKFWQNIGEEPLDITKNTTSLDLIKDYYGKIQEGVIDIYARDAKGNESHPAITVEVSQEKNNTILFGPENVPSRIQRLLEEAKENEDKDDPLDGYPIIKSIYVLNGVLYVEATDDKGIFDYGFQWRYKSTMTEDFTGATIFYNNGVADRTKDEAYDNPTTFTNGQEIPSLTTMYRYENYMSIKTPNALTIYVTDTSGNVTSRNVYPTSPNQVLFGEVSDEVRDAIEKNGGQTTPPTSTTAPTITLVYTYQGYLYFEGIAPDGFHPYSYGFRVEEDSLYPGDFAGIDELGRELRISAGRIISNGTKVYKDVNYQRISIPTRITVILRDINGKEDSKTFYITDDNSLYYGDEDDLPDDVKGGLDDKTGDDDNKGDDDGGGGNSGDGKDPNTKPETETTPGIINPDDEIKDYDWSLYDYVLELRDINTNRLIYYIRKDEAKSIEMPRLQDSTTYKYRQVVVREDNNEEEKVIEGLYSTLDTIAPIIEKIWFSNYRLYVSAYDKGGLADEPYLFVINGAATTNTTYSKANNIRAVYGDNVSITVRDASGNQTTVTIEIKMTTDNVLYKCVNPTNPVFVRTGTSKTTSYWLAYLSSMFGIDTDGLEIDKANCSNISFDEVGNEIIFDFSNDGVLTYYKETNNMYYALNLRTLNAGKSFRTIIVENGSKVDFALAFERKLIDLFGTTDGITWAYEDKGIIGRDGSMVLANSPGVGKIVASRGDTKANFYVVVAETISKMKSNCDFNSENFAYTYLVNKDISLEKALGIGDDNLTYVVLDETSDGLERNGNVLKATTSGRKTMMLLDVINDVLFEYTFEAIYVTPFISTFTDIIGANNRVDIEYLCERGVITETPDFKYKSANKMTTKEFLTMLNRVRLTYDANYDINKQAKEIDLDIRDFDYYSSMNILTNFSQGEVDNILGEYSLNKALSFGEAISLISTTLLYNEHHTTTGIEVPENLEGVSEAAKHLISLGVIDANDARNASREITKSEIAYMIAQAIRFLEY